jgi:hypothetical protein
VILRDGPDRKMDGADRVMWEHGRRNLELRAEGRMPIVCPVSDGTGLAGVFIFDRGPQETRRIIDGDPAVQAGIFIYDCTRAAAFRVMPCPGRRRPGRPRTPDRSADRSADRTPDRG